MGSILVVAAVITAICLCVSAGIGFAKGMQGNLCLMTGLQQVQSRLRGAVAKQPLLAGPSRKGFLGKLTGQYDCFSYQQMLLVSGLTDTSLHCRA